MLTIPKAYRDLIEKPAFAHLATIMPNGSPQVTPVWWEVEGEYVIVNAVPGRVKDRNIRRDPRVALSILDPDNPYRRLLIRGRVVEITTEGAEQGIDRLCLKYTGNPVYPDHHPDRPRVIYKIAPERVTGQG